MKHRQFPGNYSPLQSPNSCSYTTGTVRNYSVKNALFGSWGDSRVLRSTYCSFPGPGFSAQHPPWVVHNPLQL